MQRQLWWSVLVKRRDQEPQQVPGRGRKEDDHGSRPAVSMGSQRRNQIERCLLVGARVAAVAAQHVSRGQEGCGRA